MPAGDDHWESIYASTAATDLSWYEHEPASSLRLIEKMAPRPSQAVIDVGAGGSLLVDHLLARGFTDVTVLDIAQPALREVERRLGERARHVTFVRQDVLTWTPARQYDIWHDRAVFHFLTERAARDRYVEIAAQAVRVGGGLVLATFAERTNAVLGSPHGSLLGRRRRSNVLRVLLARRARTAGARDTARYRPAIHVGGAPTHMTAQQRGSHELSS